jgi:putative alpha-1,2-mannosidase
MMPGTANSLDESSVGNVANRGVEFEHENEIAHPNYYSVKLNNNIECEVTPGDHSAIFRFNFPKIINYGSLVFDSGKNDNQYADKY